MTDFNQSRFDTIKKIKEHFSGVAKPVLDDFFGHALVGDDIEKARQVASLLEKVNSSKEANLPEPLLLEELEDEKKRNTLAYQVIITRREVSGDDYVKFAIKKLTQLEEKYSSYSNLKKDISLLKTALSSKKTELAKVLEVEKKFKDIEKEIKKLVKEGEKNDRQTNALTKNILNIDAEIAELETRKLTMTGMTAAGTIDTALITDPEMVAFNAYETTIRTLIQSIINDTNKTNKYDVRLTKIGNASITGSELRCNILFNFIKEYFEGLNPDEVYEYLNPKITGMDTAGTKAEQIAKFNNIVKYTKDVAIPKSDKDSDLYSTEEDEKLLENHYFRKLHDPATTAQKKKKIWEVGPKFKEERLVFPYEDFFSLMNAWFKDGAGDGTIRAKTYPAFTDEDTNPFKKAKLLNKEFELVFDPTDETSKIKGFTGNDANSWYINNVTKRDSVKFNNLQDAIIEFYSFFTSGATGNKDVFLATTATESWQILASGHEYQEGYTAPATARDDKTYFGILGQVLDFDLSKMADSPLIAFDQYLEKKKNDKKIAEKSVDAYNARRIEKIDLPAIDELDKLDPLQESLKEIKKTALGALLEKARELYKITNDGVNLKLLTDSKIDSIIYYLNEVKKFKGSLETSDKSILDKVTKLRKEVDEKAIFWKSYKNLKGDTFEEKLKKDLKFDEQYARNLHNDFEVLKGIITLEDDQSQVLTKLSAIIAELVKGDKWEDIKGSDTPTDTPKLTKLEVQGAFVDALGDDAKPEDTIAETWTEFNNTKSELSTVEQIKNFIETKIKDKKTEFLSHIDANLPDADKPAADSDENKRIAEFVKSKEAKTVIKAVISHEIETDDERKKIVNRMKADKDDEKPLDMSKYGTNPGNVEDPTNEAIIEYRYREIAGKDQEHGKSSKKDDKVKKEGFVAKWIAPYGYAGVWVPLSLIGIIVFYFWNNIANWWNGPAEEGELTEEGEK